MLQSEVDKLKRGDKVINYDDGRTYLVTGNKEQGKMIVHLTRPMTFIDEWHLPEEGGV